MNKILKRILVGFGVFWVLCVILMVVALVLSPKEKTSMKDTSSNTPPKKSKATKNFYATKEFFEEQEFDFEGNSSYCKALNFKIAVLIRKEDERDNPSVEFGFFILPKLEDNTITRLLLLDYAEFLGVKSELKDVIDNLFVNGRYFNAETSVYTITTSKKQGNTFILFTPKK